MKLKQASLDKLQNRQTEMVTGVDITFTDRVFKDFFFLQNLRTPKLWEEAQDPLTPGSWAARTHMRNHPDQLVIGHHGS